MSVSFLSMRIAALRRVAARANVFIASPDLLGLGSTMWKAWPSRPVLVGDVVDRRRDVVDGHEVRVAPLHGQQREPLRQRVADLLERLEEVVGPVDLVHLAGLRVADHDRRAVDPPGALHALAHELLGLELGPVVGVGELLALVEHVLVKRPLKRPGHGDGGDVVKDAVRTGVGEVDRRSGCRPR
jgi:hypothetical protein